jgi:DNA helicase-2/ATP-dependent DNA helicase PcrA
MDERDLTPRQHEVVDSQDALVLVLGGAGSGKTTTALWAARAELLRHPRDASRVGFLTFSRTAVSQIAARSQAALSTVGERVEVFTFHGFAFRLVRSFGRYVGLGEQPPEIQSPAQLRLLGRRDDQLTYDDLLPQALEVLGSNRVRRLLAARWPLIICDEFQDTSEDQWQLLDVLRQESRMILLGDPNQLIYSFLPGVGPQRLRDVRQLATRVIELEPISHRDPSGGIPAMADAVRQRDFGSDAVRDADEQGRLSVRTGVDEDEHLLQVISQELKAAWAFGARDYGIFGHSNEGVAALGHDLAQAGIDHILIGLTDAQGEALVAMSVMFQVAAGTGDLPSLRLAIATYLTACSRGRDAPALAMSLASDSGIPAALSRRLATLVRRLADAAPDVEAVVAVVEDAWSSLGIVVGGRPWARAVPLFGSAARRVARRGAFGREAATRLEAEIRQLRTSALLDSTRARRPPVQLMNFHQTKGREADAVLLVYRDGDYLAGSRDSEPFVKSSRVLYVALSRARMRVSVILPSDPHPLVAPFAGLA